ncbi:hypothetical protein IM792_05545 [Mucilaginibacter sp. JRF]|jgi:predicted small secreted protein|uniref:hypothetical protein n=1 Tax=Mucilaginibacter sp. JRF TaxID=2780088 RepID=UPI001882EE08|nr:hypothetical protein [Mucilaginibacter sp. JRF]MBE9583904.1 hypothetical protein [Mucilaginibacter sp. JRF]
MKKLFLIPIVVAALAFTACSGTNQQGAGTDSPQNANDTTLNTDTVIKHTDSSSTGVDNSGSGGTAVVDSGKKE